MNAMPRTVARTVLGPLTAALAVVGTVAATAPAEAAAPMTEVAGSPSTMNAMVATTRAAVARFHDVDAALAAGYLPVGGCVESPAGAMGFHYMNPALVHPGAPVDPAQPPFLTYGPSASGGLELWAAEFFEPDLGQPTPMYGTQPFDGPMPGHEPGMPTHYDLHVWVGKHNPAGIFVDFNPALHC